MTLSEELRWRGFINQTTFADLRELDKKPLTFYQGFDASASSQTVGNLAFMMMARVLLRHGHKAIILAGGATSLIGDPGGKDTERVLQDEKTIAQNIENAKQELQRVLQGHKFTLVNNLDWTKQMNVIEFLRDIGKHFSMTPLVQRDYIARRIGNEGGGISYTEFSYTLLQGMDFLHLYDKHGVTLQLGGSDQWGNCLSGVELIRKARGAESHVITMPLIINKATGKKFGKSEEGAVWLDAQKTTPTQFYQFWVSIDDEGVEYYLKIFTELSKEEIDKIMAEHRQAPRNRIAQSALAEAVTRLVHGAEQTVIARVITNVLTGRIGVGEVADKVIAQMRHEIPHARVKSGADLADILVDTRLATSKTEARRFIKENAVAVNHQKTTKETLDKDDFTEGRLLLRRGKAFKDSALVELA